MKSRILSFILLAQLIPFSVLACEVCQNKQPKVLKGITHGTGPEGNVDYIIIWSAVAIVAVTLFLSLKFLMKPERNENHIKNIILNQ